VNPVLSDPDGEEPAEEGCLSIPNLHVDVTRSKTIRINAQDLAGNPFEQIETGYLARIWQHETDHLNGILITDRIGPTARMTHRKLLKDLEADYATLHPPAAAPRAKPRRR
jgi:peptide deformylase